MYDKKTELILKWQYRKDHFYFFSHDDRNLKNYFKDFSLRYFLIMMAVLCSGSVVMGLIFGFMIKNILGAIIGCFCFILFFLLYMRIYSFFLYLNYVECDEIYGPFFAVILSIVVWSTFKNGFIGILAYCIMIFCVMKFDKSQNYEKQNPLGDFLKENGVED